MITFTVGYNARDFFFDRPRIVAALSKPKRKALSKAGAFVRTAARSSLRRRKGPSSPGSPPSVHAPSGERASLKTILFAYDAQRDSVVVGPVKLNQVNFKTDGGRISIPALHEFGGELGIREWKFTALDERTYEMVRDNPTAANFLDVWSRRDLRWRMTSRKRPWSLMTLGVQTRMRKAKYPARPFMRPALESVSDRFSDLFRDCIRAA
jgi:hypothetical protein